MVFRGTALYTQQLLVVVYHTQDRKWMDDDIFVSAMGLRDLLGLFAIIVGLRRSEIRSHGRKK